MVSESLSGRGVPWGMGSRGRVAWETGDGIDGEEDGRRRNRREN